MGYPPKKLQPAANAPIARASLPCQKATLPIILHLPHSDSQIGADVLALTTPDAFSHLKRLSFLSLVKGQYFLRADLDAKRATLAPWLIDDNLKCLCQRIHLQKMPFPLERFRTKKQTLFRKVPQTGASIIASSYIIRRHRLSSIFPSCLP